MKKEQVIRIRPRAEGWQRKLHGDRNLDFYLDKIERQFATIVGVFILAVVIFNGVRYIVQTNTHYQTVQEVAACYQLDTEAERDQCLRR